MLASVQCQSVPTDADKDEKEDDDEDDGDDGEGCSRPVRSNLTEVLDDVVGHS